MKIWEELSQVDIKNKETFQRIFSKIVSDVRFGNQRKSRRDFLGQENCAAIFSGFKIEVGEVEKEDHFIVTEENRMNACFVHIVPKEVYVLFKEMQSTAPNEFLGFSVLAGKFNSKDIRVSCFGVPCGNLGKALFKK